MTFAGTMHQAPLSLAKMSCDAATGTVTYRSKMPSNRSRRSEGGERINSSAGVE